MISASSPLDLVFDPLLPADVAAPRGWGVDTKEIRAFWLYCRLSLVPVSVVVVYGPERVLAPAPGATTIEVSVGLNVLTLRS